VTTAPTLQDLVERYAGDPTPAHREAAILAGVPLVRSLLGKIAVPDHPLASYDDLESAGLLGLVEALNSYESGRGAKFITFAYLRVRGAIVDYLRSIDVLSLDKRKLYQEAGRASEAIRQATGREPADRDVAERLGISLQDYDRLLVEAQARFALSLHAPTGGEDGPTIGEDLEDESALDAFGDHEREHTMAIVRRAIEHLPARSRAMLGLYYDEGLTLREIGEVYNISEARVSQILGKTMLQLREQMQPSVQTTRVAA
jgi:RNA polymerase sigma factor for flagellar operon FliA